MRTILLAVFAAFLATVAVPAQAVTIDCTVSCTVVSDAFPPLPSPQPTQCKLFDGAALVATTAVEAVTGGVRCKFTRTIAANVTVSYTAVGVFATGDGPPSAPPLAITSATTPPPPATFTLGETAILSGAGSGNANLLMAQNATLAQPGTVVSMSFYVVAASGNIRLAIYDATGPAGGPGALKAQTGSFVSVLGWNTANVVAPVALAPGTYWLAHVLSSNTLSESFATIAGTASKYQALTFGSLPATFSTTPTAYAPHFSIYATLNSGGPPPALPAPTNLRATVP